MPITGLRPAVMRERSSLTRGHPRSAVLRRIEDLAEIHLLALGVVKAEERDALLVRDPAGEVLEGQLVDERRQRLRHAGRHREEDVGGRSRSSSSSAAMMMTRESISRAACGLLEPAVAPAPGGRMHEGVGVRAGDEIFLVRPLLELGAMARSRQRLVPLGHGEIGRGEVRPAAEHDRLAVGREARRDLSATGRTVASAAAMLSASA